MILFIIRTHVYLTKISSFAIFPMIMGLQQFSGISNTVSMGNCGCDVSSCHQYPIVLNSSSDHKEKIRKYSLWSCVIYRKNYRIKYTTRHVGTTSEEILFNQLCISRHYLIHHYFPPTTHFRPFGPLSYAPKLFYSSFCLGLPNEASFAATYVGQILLVLLPFTDAMFHSF